MTPSVLWLLFCNIRLELSTSLPLSDRFAAADRLLRLTEKANKNPRSAVIFNDLQPIFCSKNIWMFCSKNIFLFKTMDVLFKQMDKNAILLLEHHHFGSLSFTTLPVMESSESLGVGGMEFSMGS